MRDSEGVANEGGNEIIFLIKDMVDLQVYLVRALWNGMELSHNQIVCQKKDEGEVPMKIGNGLAINHNA